MDAEVPAPKDGQDVHVGGSVQQAVELVGKMLEQIQIELEKMLSQRGEVPPEIDALENEKDKSQKRYKDLESNYQKISEELKAFGRQMITPAKSGQVQAELNLAQAKKDIEKLRAEVEKLQAQCNDYQAQAHQPLQNVKKLETQLEELKLQNIELQRKKIENFGTQEMENITLRDELTTLRSQTTQRDSDFALLQQKLETSQKETKHYQQQSRTFRRIIQSTNVPMEINELDVGLDFKWLRDEIHRIVCRYYSMEKDYSVPGNSTSQNTETHLYNLFNLVSDQFEREIGVRAFVFGQLDGLLLFKELFGLEDLDESLGIEQGLRNFEVMFKQNHPDRHAELTAWRTATMECARFLRPASLSHPPDLCKSVAGELMRLLNPLGTYPQEETDQLIARWQELCMMALKLTMKLRKYKDVYRCEMPALGDIVKVDDMEIEYVVHRETCKKYAELNGWPIAYVLSGEWVRYSAEEPEKKVSLVKPWGVVYAHPGESI